MNEETYLSDRVDDQINWYDRKSQSSQLCFKGLRGFEIVAAAAIPLIAGFGAQLLPGWMPLEVTLGVLGASIAIASAFLSLNRCQENWMSYRTTSESLKLEKFLFLTRANPYHEEGAFTLFVHRAERLISSENSAWLQYNQTEADRATPSVDASLG